jgi:subtilisin family serine protease
MATGEFILLPRRGLFSAGPQDPADAFLRGLPRVNSMQPAMPAAAAFMPAGPRWDMRVIDSVAENGPKLVTMDAAAAAQANASGSVTRAVPVVTYKLPQPMVKPTTSPAPAAGFPVVVECLEVGSGTPIPNAEVIAFDNFVLRTGAAGVTDAAGRVSLSLSAPAIDRLYVYTSSSHWGAYRSGVPAIGTVRVDVEPVVLPYMDAVRHYYGASRYVAATGVTVGVIDTGVGPHPDLRILSGRNTVTGEPPGAFDDWNGHGSHVAGLIGANGAAGAGLRGVAPGIGVRAYRVFGAGGAGATNYSILKAMILAANEQCDIINLSLGGGPYDPIVEEAIIDARDQGMLVVIAAGNDGRGPVSYPARYPGATAVSAMGREGTFPAGSVAEGDVERPPYPTDPLEFIASFSNIGVEIAVTGPGVGVLSTLPGGSHGPMSGTSMAAPVVAGAAASLLSQNAAIFGMARDRARSDAIERLLQTNCTKRGFGLLYEAFGLPDPAVV